MPSEVVVQDLHSLLRPIYIEEHRKQNKTTMSPLQQTEDINWCSQGLTLVLFSTLYNINRDMHSWKTEETHRS